MKLACAGWGFREMPLEVYFKVAADLEVHYVEVNCQAGVPPHVQEDMKEDQVGAVKRSADACGVEIVALAPGSDFTLEDPGDLEREVLRVKRIIDLGERLESSVIRLFAGWIGEEKITEATYRQVAECFDEVGEYAGDKGIVLALENHGGVTANIERTRRIMESISSDAVGLNYDPANFAHSGEDPVEAVRALKDYIVYVHLKDYLSEEAEETFCALGEGRIEWEPIFSELSDFYQGYFAIEYERPDDVVEGTRKSAAFVKALLRG